MRALLQRVQQASVHINGECVGAIDQGLLVFLGVQKGDDKSRTEKLLQKIVNYRIFSDDQQKMNLSVKDIGGGLLIISQFTLAAETQKGLRPGFSLAASPEQAEALYDYFLQQARDLALEKENTIASGVFGADMQVSLINDGPVTFLLEV